MRVKIMNDACDISTANEGTSLVLTAEFHLWLNSSNANTNCYVCYGIYK